MSQPTNGKDPWLCQQCGYVTHTPIGWILQLSPANAVLAAFCRACAHLLQFGPTDRLVQIEGSAPEGAVEVPLERPPLAALQARRPRASSDPPRGGLRGLARAIRVALGRYLLEGT